MVDSVLLSPTFPPGGVGVNPALMSGGGGFDRMRKTMIRKTVDYHCSVLRYLENRVWQRDSRDKPIIQPDTSYFNEVVVPQGLLHSPVNSVTTKFVKACTNKARSPIFCTAWVPDGRRLVTGAASGEFTLWNGVNFNFESIIQAHDCSVRSMTWSHSGKWLVTTDDRGFIKYWQINFNNVHTFQAHSEAVRSSSFSPTDSKLATCSDDGTVRIFDFLSCTEEHLLRGHGADVKCLQWHPTKSLIVSGSKDNQQPVKLWDPKAGQSVCTIHAHKATVMDVKWNQNGNWFGTASRDHLIKIYDIRMMKELWVLKGHKKDVNTISWHPVHETLFTSGGSDGAILFWTLGNSREIGGMESAHEGFVWSLSWHPLGHLLCSGANDHTCKFWCRNRPGEEIKDKYNNFHNPFFAGEEDSMPYHLPGMGVGLSHGGVSLPPPSHMTSAVNLPPPQMINSWKPQSESMSTEPPLQLLSPQRNVPVLGADIIAQTFAEKQTPNDFHSPMETQTGVINEHTLNNFRGPPRDFDERTSMMMMPHGPFDGQTPHTPTGPGGFRGIPPDDGPGYNNPFSWHNPEINPRHQGYEEDHRWPNQGGNRFVYRRNEGPGDNFADGRRQSIEDRRKDDWRHPNRHGDGFSNRDMVGPFSQHRKFSRDQPEPDNHSPWQPPPSSPLFLSSDPPQGLPRDHRGPHNEFHGPPPSHDPRGLPPSHDPRGPPGSHDHWDPPSSHNVRGLPPRDSHGPLSPHDHNGPPTSHDNRRLPSSHDPRGPPLSRDPHEPLPSQDNNHGPPSSPDPRGPPPSLDGRRPPPSHDPRGPPPILDGHRLPPSHDLRGPPSSDTRGPPPSSDGRRSSLTHDPRGPPPSHDNHGSPSSPDPRGPLSSHDPRGPPPSPDPRGPPPSHDPRGPPPSHDPRGPPPSHDPRGPLASRDPRGPPPSHDPRGPPPSHDPHGPPPSHDPRGPPPSHDPHGPPPSHDPRGPPPSHDPHGPPASHDPRGPPPSHDPHGPLPSHDPRGPPPSHDPRGPPPSHDPCGPPPSNGPSHDPRGHYEPREPPLHDPRGPLPSQGLPPEAHMVQHGPPDDNRYKQHRPPPQGYHNQDFQDRPNYQNERFARFNDSHDPRFERRGGTWHNPGHRGGRKEMMYNDERRGGGRGRGRGRDGIPNSRRGSFDDRDDPPLKRPRN